MSGKKPEASKWAMAFKDSRWQKKRLEIMERDQWQCQSCQKGKDDGITLNVHHVYYESGKAPWEYDESVLITLCEKCHETVTRMQKKFLRLMIGGKNRFNGLEQEWWVVCGFVDSFSAPVGDGLETSVDYMTGYAAGVHAMRTKALFSGGAA